MKKNILSAQSAQSSITPFSSDVITVYKKVRISRDGTPLPLFIDNKRPFAIGKWMHCEYHPTKGFAPRSCGRKPVTIRNIEQGKFAANIDLLSKIAECYDCELAVCDKE